jgi:hypothetical protein
MDSGTSEHTVTDEQFYDTQIAPVLLKLAKKCQARNLPFFAVVEFTREESDIARAREEGDDNEDPKIFAETTVCLSETMLRARACFIPQTYATAITITHSPKDSLSTEK